MAKRQAKVIWEGTLPEGQGNIQLESGALAGAPVTWASRMEAPEGKTSPEEMLAAAEAECYAMGLAHALSQRGNPPRQLEVAATATVEPQDTGGLKITTMHLDVAGNVPGVDQNTFTKMANEAEQTCPVSNAMRGNVRITLSAKLGVAAGF